MANEFNLTKYRDIDNFDDLVEYHRGLRASNDYLNSNSFADITIDLAINIGRILTGREPLLDPTPPHHSQSIEFAQGVSNTAIAAGIATLGAKAGAFGTISWGAEAVVAAINSGAGDHATAYANSLDVLDAAQKGHVSLDQEAYDFLAKELAKATFPDKVSIVEDKLEIAAEKLGLNSTTLSDAINNCFVAGTNIYMWPSDPSLQPNEYGAYDTETVHKKVWKKRIENISSGDIVVSYDTEGNLKPGKVKQTFQNHTTDLIRLRRGDEYDDLFTTPGHLFLGESGNFFRIGDQLQFVGEEVSLVDFHGNIVTAKRSKVHPGEIENSPPKDDSITQVGWRTYNFEVEDFHTYIADGNRVHNDSFYSVKDVPANRTVSEVIGTLGKVIGYRDVLDGNNNPVNAGSVDEEGNTVSSPGAGGHVGHDGSPSAWGGGEQPVILDLNNDGVEISFDQKISFDWDQDGYRERTSWVSADDGFLVIDLNADGSRGSGDGQIDQARELAFTLWGNEDDTDLQGLRRAFDDNNDGVLNTSDSVWNELRIWQDLDQDGETDNGELRSLADWGITQINLGYDDGSDYDHTDDDITVYGNTLHGLASYTRNGEAIEGGVGDVSLAASEQGWRRVETSSGFTVELENGETYQYQKLDETGPDDIDLVSAWLDGAEGNDNANLLDASGHTRSVSVNGGAGADTVLGGQADDILIGGEGSDSLDGGAGNDLVIFDADDVAIRGGDGFDSALYSGTSSITFDLAANGFERASGGDASDTLIAEYTSTSVWLYGRAGQDLLRGGGADDLLSGGEGNDTLYAQVGDDLVIGGIGQDQLHGEDGDDYLLGGDGHDNLDGGNGDDQLFGGDNEDTLWGRDGDDTLYGDAANDVLRGEAGDDVLFGGDHNDRLMGGDGDDFLNGGEGRDTIYGGAGDDVAYGGAEYDLFFDGDGDDVYKGGGGNDIFELQTHSGQNVVQGGLGTDTLRLNGHRDMWQWESVHKTSQVQTGTVEGGPDGGQPIYSTAHQGKGQYIFYSGDAVVHVQDVEQVVFLGNSGKTFWSHKALEDEEAFSLNYVASYDDLIANDEVDNTSSNWTIGRDHWVNYGQAENREVTFNPLQYLAANPSVYQLHGFDLTAATRHYIDTGHDAGLSRGDFDAEQYLKNYSDMRSQFGADLSAATRHYIEHGRAAGRTDDAVSGAMTDAEFAAWLTSLADQDEVIYLVEADAGEDNEATFYFADRDDLEIADPNAVIFGHAIVANNTSAGSGNDTIYADSTSTGHWLYLNQQESTSGSEDTLRGGDGADVIYAGADDDSVFGDSGSDSIAGQDGDDILRGQDGSDSITGGDGQDTLYGHDGADVLVGGLGNDYVRGGNGADRQWGGEGDDSVYGDAGADTLFGENGNDTLKGHDGSDVLLGGEGNDTLDGMNGSDRLYGEAGNDSLVGDLGDDRLEGNVGDDTLSGGSGNDYLDGGEGDDSLSGGNAQDALFGGEGADTLDGGGDNDILYGNDGTDSLDGGSANDALHGGAGADTLNGGDGIDAASYAGSSEAVYVRLDGTNASNFTGDAVGDVFSGIENLFGSEHDDQLYGDASHNVLWGADGNDTLNGLAGNDDLMGGDGADRLIGDSGIDRLSGESGADSLYGGADRDFLFGGADDDHLEGGAGNDSLSGGDGNDSIYVGADDANVSGNDTADGGAGDDLIIGSNGYDHLKGGDGNDTLNGGDDLATAERDTLEGGTGNDSITSGQVVIPDADRQIYGDYMYGGGGDDTITGGKGDDVIYTGGPTDNLVGFDHASGGDGDDLIHGSNGKDLLFGDAGNDTLTGGNDGITADADTLDGGDGNDSLTSGQTLAPEAGREGLGDHLFGQAGDDTLTGGAANDVLKGGSGNDELWGGDGNDSIYSGAAEANQSGNDTADGGAGDDLLVGSNGYDHLKGGDGNDTLNGGDDLATAERDTLEGGAGNDSITSGQVETPDADRQAFGDRMYGGGGDDTITGGKGDDVIYTSGPTENLVGFDHASGGDGDDQIFGSNGKDLLHGDAGNDTLTGGDDGITADADTLYGGDGNDHLTSGQTDAPEAGREALGDHFYGEAGNDTLTGGKANDYLEGGTGADSFVFLSDFGQDTIADFSTSQSGETIDLSGVSQITSFSDLTTNHLTQSGSDALISDGAGNTITLTGINMADLTADDFLF